LCDTTEISTRAMLSHGEQILTEEEEYIIIIYGAIKTEVTLGL